MKKATGELYHNLALLRITIIFFSTTEESTKTLCKA